MKILLCLYCAALSYTSHAQNDHQLSVVFTNIQKSEGNIMIKVVDEKDKVITANYIKAEEEKSIFSLELPTGNYAIKAYHDINENGELDKNKLGIPQEPYGFSNNARSTFGPPELKDQLITLDRNKRIYVKLD